MQSNPSKPATRTTKRSTKLDTTYTIHVQAIDDLVQISVTSFGITVFQRAISTDKAQELGVALAFAAGF